MSYDQDFAATTSAPAKLHGELVADAAIVDADVFTVQYDEATDLTRVVWASDTPAQAKLDAAAAVVAAHDPTPLRKKPQRAVSNGVSSTSGTDPVDKVQLASAKLRAGPHLLHWYAEVRITGGDAGAEAAADVDANGTQLGMIRTDAANYVPFSGSFLAANVDDGDQPTVTIRFQRAGGTTGDVDIRRARLFLLRADGIED